MEYTHNYDIIFIKNLDIFNGVCYYILAIPCGCSTSASASAFQAEEVGSIPITRSRKALIAQLDRASAF